MTAKPKTFKASIFGEVYSFITDEPEQQLQQAASMVDLLMREIAEKSNLVDSKRLAVLVALRMASRMVDLESQIAKRHQENERLIDLIDRELSPSYLTK